MNVKNRQQLLTIVAIGCVALWLGNKLVFTPLTGTWEDRTKQIARLKKSVDDGSLMLKREKSIREDWDKKRVNTLSNKVSVAESQVLKACERWAQDSRVSITSTKPQPKHNADDYMTVDCRIDGFGSLSALTRFLYEVEKDPLAFKVEAVEISAQDKEGQQLTLGLQVSGLLLTPTGQ